MFQAVWNILGRVWPGLEQHVDEEIEEEIEEEVYTTLYRIVESIEHFQETVERTTGRSLGVNVDIPIFADPGGTGGAIVQIRLPVNQRNTTSSNTDAVQVRLPENENLPERNDVAAEDDVYRIAALEHRENEIYEPIWYDWEVLYPSPRQNGEEPFPNVTSQEMIRVIRNAQAIRLQEMGIGEGIAGATEEEIEQLALPTATAEHVDEICSVCLEQFERDTVLTILPCEHVFHPSCIRSWLLRNPSCPIDRRSIFEDS